MSRKTKNTIIFLWIYFLGSPNGNKQAKSESKIPQFRYKFNGLTVIHVFDIFVL